MSAAQEPDGASGRRAIVTDWDGSFGGAGAEWANGLAQTTHGDWVVAGVSDSEPGGGKQGAHFGSTDAWVIKLNAQGVKLWDRAFGGTDADDAAAVAATADGGCLVAGISYSDPGGNKSAQQFGNGDFWVLRLDRNGVKLWDRSFGGNDVDGATSLAATPDGGCLVAGYSISGPGGNKTSEYYGDYDFWVVRLGAGGNLLWDRSCGGSSFDWATAVTLTPDHGCLVAGYSQSAPDGNKSGPRFGSRDFWIVKLDSAGNVGWDRTFGGVSSDYAQAAFALPDEGAIVAGCSGSAPGGNKANRWWGLQDLWVLRVDRNGAKLWEQSVGGADNDYAQAAILDTEGRIAVAGYSNSGVSGAKTAPNFGQYDLWLVGLDAQGNRLWDHALGGSGSDWTSAIAPAPDGGYVLAGGSNSSPSAGKSSPNLGDFDVWVVKVHPETPPAILAGGLAGPLLTFTNLPSVEVRIASKWTNLFYTLDGSPPSAASIPYAGPFGLSSSATVRAVAFTEAGSALLADPLEIRFAWFYDVRATTAGGGKVSLTPAPGPYLGGSSVAAKAEADAGWEFLGWQGAGTGADPVLNLAVDRDLTVEAVFGAGLAVTASGAGAVELLPRRSVYPFGSVVTAAVIPLPGSYFVRWTLPEPSLDNPRTLAVTNGAAAVEAVFEPLAAGQVALTVAPNGLGTVRVEPEGRVFDCGQVVRLRATAAGTGRFLGWTGAYEGAEAEISLPLDESKVLWASFPGADPFWLGPVVFLDRPGLLDGTPTFEFKSGRAGIYRLQVSTDLRAWADWMTLTNAGETIRILDPQGTIQSPRFFRALTP